MATGQCDGAPRPVEEVLTGLEELLDELAGSVALDDVATSRLVEASARLRVAGTRIDALRWSVLPRIETAGLWALTGARTFAIWLARAEDVQTLTARRDVRTAKALRDHLPATLTAALAGKVGVDKVRVLVDVATTSTPRTDALGAPAIDLPTTEPSEPAPGDVGDTDGDTAEPAPENPGDDTAGDIEGAGTSTRNPADPAPVDAADPAEPAGSGAPTWEEQLQDWSTQNGPDRFRGLVRYFARHADPDADERGYTKTKHREYLDVSPTLGGYHLSGFLTEEHGQVLTTALGSVMGAPAAGDDRTPGQRRAQALADLTRLVLDNAHTGTGASVRPHLSVTVSWTELQALATKNATRTTTETGTAVATAPGITPHAEPLWDTTGAVGTGMAGVGGLATGSLGPNLTGTYGRAGVPGVKRPAVFTETGTPIPASLLRRIACDSEITRIVFGPDSQVLDVGRAKRTITGQLRRAVIARDKHCVLGQCDQPPSRCEVHHAVQHWADGGHTSITNAALLCYHHHDLVDTQGITMHYDNGWHFTDRTGHPVHTT